MVGGAPNETDRGFYTCEKRSRIRVGGSATYRFTRKYPRATYWLVGRPSYNQGTPRPIQMRTDAEGKMRQKTER